MEEEEPTDIIFKFIHKIKMTLISNKIGKDSMPPKKKNNWAEEAQTLDGEEADEIFEMEAVQKRIKKEKANGE